jgi:hypothetical protein
MRPAPGGPIARSRQDRRARACDQLLDGQRRAERGRLGERVRGKLQSDGKRAAEMMNRDRYAALTEQVDRLAVPRDPHGELQAVLHIRKLVHRNGENRDGGCHQGVEPGHARFDDPPQFIMAAQQAEIVARLHADAARDPRGDERIHPAAIAFEPLAPEAGEQLDRQNDGEEALPLLGLRKLDPRDRRARRLQLPQCRFASRPDGRVEAVEHVLGRQAETQGRKRMRLHGPSGQDRKGKRGIGGRTGQEARWCRGSCTTGRPRSYRRRRPSSSAQKRRRERRGCGPSRPCRFR